MPTLLLSARYTADHQALWRAAVHRGWNTARMQGLRVPDIADPHVVIYVEALFGPHVAAHVNRALVEMPEDWLPRVPLRWLHRRIHLSTLGEVRRTLDRPQFIKPPNDKTFPAQVVADREGLPTEFDDDVAVLVADPVSFGNEYRCFCLDQRVLTSSPYVIDGVHAQEVDYAAPEPEHQEAQAFAEAVLTEVDAPRALALDVGRLADGRWAVVEANGAWGAGLYGCDPDRALDVISAATVSAASTKRLAHD